MRPDHRAHRLYVEASLREGADVVLSPEQSHYLDRVMRAKMGDVVIAFNNHEGEWRGHIAETGRKAVTLHLDQALRPPAPQGRVSYFFAPLKQARLDYMVQKAVEMGVASLQPVLTQHTMVQRLNLDRMRANAIALMRRAGRALRTGMEVVAGRGKAGNCPFPAGDGGQ